MTRGKEKNEMAAVYVLFWQEAVGDSSSFCHPVDKIRTLVPGLIRSVNSS